MEQQLNVKVRLFGLENTYIRIVRKVWTIKVCQAYGRGETYICVSKKVMIFSLNQTIISS